MQTIKPLIGGLLLVSAAYAATLAQRNCWTCPPGFIHWFDAGLPEPWDKCACVPGTTKKPQVPAPPARNCWTCAPGYAHWWTIDGYKEPTDKCACVLVKPTRNCWTCPPNYVHWYDIPGYAEPADKCACVYKQSAPVPVPPAPTAKPPTRDCWTCAPGYTHWYDIPGYKEPNDKCACVANSQATTTKPAAPTPKPPVRNCWTCAPGYVHWYDIPGYLEPTDKCACVAKSTTPTAAPGSPPAAPAPIGSGPYAGLTGKMGTFIRAMTASNGNTGSISFGSAVSPYSPWNPPPLSLVGQLLDILKSTTKFRTIMMYHIDSYTVPLVAQRGFKMLGIISINVGQDNSGMINEAIKAIKAYPDTIVAVSCGNELGHTAGLTSAVVSAVGQCVRQLKSAGITQPIGNIDTYYSWCNKNERECNTPWSAMANQVEWIGLNDYAYFSNIYSGIWPCTPPNRAAQQTMENHQRVMRLYGNKPVVLTETGWPSAPAGTTIMNTPNYVTGQQCGPANDANQKATVQSLIDLYRSKQYPMNLFSAFKEAWKGATSQHIETQWGICDGTYPYTCKNKPN